MYTGRAEIEVLTSSGEVIRRTTVDHGKKSDRWRVRLIVHDALCAGHTIITKPCSGGEK